MPKGITRISSADFTRVFDILDYQLEKYPNKHALNYYSGGRWQSLTVQEVKQRSEALACWFIREGFQPGDMILIVPVMGTPEWMIIDFACQQAGLIVVPVHATVQDAELQVILEETEAQLCITADLALYYKFKSFPEARGRSLTVYHLDSTEKGYFKGIAGVKPADEELTKLSSIRQQIQPDDLLTVMYTSGSSGIPKGVMLSHGNVVSGIKSILTILPIEPGQRVLSFLPFSHIFERAATYTYIASGMALYFSHDKDSFAHDFRTVRPHFCTSVPRVLEKMYAFMQEQSMQAHWLKRKLIAWAMQTGKQYRPHVKNPVLFIKLFFARVLVLSQWRKKLGGRIRYMVVGAASLQPEIARLFAAGGIMVVEGYGMTETSPFISTNRFEPGQNRYGTVGMAVPGVEIKIDEPDEAGEGEILVKGANVMKGYFKRPELTESVFTADGWFRTGDVGKIRYGRFLAITDRKKDIFKTSAGKYIAPMPLQNHFRQSPFIQRCLIIGFQKPFVTALIVPDFELLQAWCAQQSIHWTAPEFMVYNIKVRAQLHAEIDRLNEELPNYQRVKDFVLCHQDWSVETGELTATLKPVRHLLMEHYQKEIDRMYH
ncbi:MAG: long-chain fatty acid--CoA ligase [Cyclobacteriaceae bacterium]|jgi:long-chain acyl-CoA synthetase|nr:long-chain fatty acid--CoA ligase [Cyclobacteriaceae bacterium]